MGRAVLRILRLSRSGELEYLVRFVDDDTEPRAYPGRALGGENSIARWRYEFT